MNGRHLRIAMLSAHSCPVGALGARDTGGMSVYIRELARELGRRGHTVDVYTRVHDPNDPLVIDLGEGARLIHLLAGEQEKIHKLAVYSYLPDFACHLENFRKNNDLHYDLVFSHYWLSGWVGRYLQLWWQVPHVIMFHTLGAVKNAIGIGEDAPELRIVTERDSVQNCQRVIVATEREKAELIRYYGASPDRVSVVPCGVNLETFRPVDREAARQKLGLSDDKILLFVGRIDPLKGADRLLRALPRLGNTGSLRLVIIGGDEYSRNEVEKLRKLAAGLGIADRVTFQGIVKQDRLPYFYSAADVCVVPSYYESFGLVALESLACGTPVVASDVGDLRNIIRPGETGYVVSENTPAALADRIARLLSRPPRDTDAALAIRESVKSFGWASIAGAVIRELLPVLDARMPAVA
ncbi:MAG TPA: glycosyltransferase [Dehalococcoidales bacterium]|nr:glycosyltransferase [Dehalococcoidales bacterium]